MKAILWFLPAFAGVFLYMLIAPDPLVAPWDEVKPVQIMSFLERGSHYFILLVMTCLPVLALSFDRKVAYFKDFGKVVTTAAIISVPYILWDRIFERHGVWGFNESYISGVHFLGLPIEECLFFLIVPFACIFIYRCVQAYFPDFNLGKPVKIMTALLGLGFLGIGIFNAGQWYTATAMLVAIFVCGQTLMLDTGRISKQLLAFVLSVLPFLLVNGALTGAFTSAPVVLYHADEMLGFRLITIPVNDLVYSFGLLMINYQLFDTIKSHRMKNKYLVQ